MGTYPSLYVRPPEPIDPLQDISKAASLRSLMQNQQLQRQQMQENALTLQERQLAMADQQKLAAAMAQAQGDPDQTLALAAKAGVRPQTLLSLRQALTKQQQDALALSDAQRNSQLQQADLIQGAHDQVAALPPEQRPQGYMQAMAGLKQAGMDISKFPQQYPGDQAFSSIGPVLQLHSAILERADKEAARQKTLAETSEAQGRAKAMEQYGTASPTDQDKFVANWLKTNNLENTPQNRFKGQQEYIKETKLNPAAIRVEGYAQTREYPVIDTRNGNQLVYASAADINKSNKETPGRYAPAGEGGKALNKTALIEDIRGNLQQVRGNLQNEKMPEFTMAQRSAIALALGGPEPGGALTAAFRGGVLGNLTPEQQDYLVNMAQLTENAMAMRSVLGAGQGSEDLRSAIRATLPGPRTPSKGYALNQLQKFENVLNRLERGIPKVPLAGAAQPQTQPAGAPAVGTIVKGYKYKGGDPAKQENWEKQ